LDVHVSLVPFILLSDRVGRIHVHRDFSAGFPQDIDGGDVAIVTVFGHYLEPCGK